MPMHVGVGPLFKVFLCAVAGVVLGPSIFAELAQSRRRPTENA
jgi:hypothetical protein